MITSRQTSNTQFSRTISHIHIITFTINIHKNNTINNRIRSYTNNSSIQSFSNIHINTSTPFRNSNSSIQLRSDIITINIDNSSIINTRSNISQINNHSTINNSTIISHITNNNLNSTIIFITLVKYICSIITCFKITNSQLNITIFRNICIISFTINLYKNNTCSINRTHINSDYFIKSFKIQIICTNI